MTSIKNKEKKNQPAFHYENKRKLFKGNLIRFHIRRQKRKHESQT